MDCGKSARRHLPLDRPAGLFSPFGPTNQRSGFPASRHYQISFCYRLCGDRRSGDYHRYLPLSGPGSLIGSPFGPVPRRRPGPELSCPIVARAPRQARSTPHQLPSLRAQRAEGDRRSTNPGRLAAIPIACRAGLPRCTRNDIPFASIAADTGATQNPRPVLRARRGALRGNNHW